MKEMTKKRAGKITMGIALVVLAAIFWLSISYHQEAGAVGKRAFPVQEMKSEAIAQGKNESYIARALKVHEVLSHYQENIISSAQYGKILRGEQRYEDGDIGAIYFDPFEDLRGEGYEEEPDECLVNVSKKALKEDFTYVQKGHAMICYCKKHNKISGILPYRMYEAEWVSKLEDCGLEGLGQWMKLIEQRGTVVEMSNHKKAVVSLDRSYNRVFGGILVRYEYDYMEFTANPKLGISYRYLDQMQESLEKIGWTVSDLMTEGYYKGIRCRLYPQGEKMYDTETNGEGVQAILMVEQGKIAQVSFYIDRGKMENDEAIFLPEEKKPLQEMFALLGMEKADAVRLSEELISTNGVQKGVRDGFEWKLSKVDTHIGGQEKTCEYVLYLYAKK